MLLKILQESERAAWPRVVNNGVVTGEFRETLLGLASLWKGQAPKAEETQSAPTLGSGGPARDAIPPAAQQERGLRQQMVLSVEVVSLRNLMRVGQSRWG